MAAGPYITIDLHYLAVKTRTGVCYGIEKAEEREYSICHNTRIFRVRPCSLFAMFLTLA